MKVSFVIPVFNEEQNIPEIYTRCISILESAGTDAYEFLFVNDGSTDRSIDRIRGLNRADRNVKYLDLSRNFGQQIALSAGLDHCSGDRIVILDADLQDPPECIPDMLARLEEGFDVVYAKRRHRSGESWLKKWTAKWFYRLFSALVPMEIPLDTGDFRAIRRNVVDVLRSMPEQQKFLRGQIAWMGFRQSSIEYDRPERKQGTTGYTFGKMFRLALDGITSFSDFPLRLVTLSGFLFSFIAFLVMLYALYSKYILKDIVQGWTSIMISVLFIGGVQLIAIGILGAYISRLHQNTRSRPLYIVRDSNL